MRDDCSIEILTRLLGEISTPLEDIYSHLHTLFAPSLQILMTPYSHPPTSDLSPRLFHEIDYSDSSLFLGFRSLQPDTVSLAGCIWLVPASGTFKRYLGERPYHRDGLLIHKDLLKLMTTN